MGNKSDAAIVYNSVPFEDSLVLTANLLCTKRYELSGLEEALFPLTFYMPVWSSKISKKKSNSGH